MGSVLAWLMALAKLVLIFRRWRLEEAGLYEMAELYGLYFWFSGNFWTHPHRVRVPRGAVPGGVGADRHHNTLWPHGGGVRPGEVSRDRVGTGGGDKGRGGVRLVLPSPPSHQSVLQPSGLAYKVLFWLETGFENPFLSFFLPWEKEIRRRMSYFIT